MKSKERELNELIVKDLLDFFKNPITLIQEETMTISRAPEVSFLEYDITEYLNFKKHNDDILFFTKTLKTEFSHCDLSIFYQNLKTLKFINRNTLATILYSRLANDPEAVYFIPINAIKIYGDKKNKDYSEKSALMHELLHMAATCKEEERTFFGISQNFRNMTIGEGINEGYTEYLNEKNFFCEGSEYYSYLGEKYLIQGIEKIVGIKEMEKLYFSADLNGIITSIERYSDKEKAFTIIDDMDAFNRVDDPFTKQYLFNQLKTSISNIYKNKLDQDFTNNIITNNQYKRELDFLTEFSSGNYVFYGKKTNQQENDQLTTNFNDRNNLVQSSENSKGVSL